MQKIYCYVDESGQDTKGELFLVSVVLKNLYQLAELQKVLEAIENESRKHKRKWTKTSDPIKLKYLNLLLESGCLVGAVFYSAYHNTMEYTPLISLTIAKSIVAKKVKDYSAAIIIDGLKGAETEYIRRQLKNLNIHYQQC